MTRPARRCPICDKATALTKDGRIGWHRDTRHPPGTGPLNPACAGWNRLPDDQTAAPPHAATVQCSHCGDDPPIGHTCPACGTTTLEGAAE